MAGSKTKVEQKWKASTGTEIPIVDRAGSQSTGERSRLPTSEGAAQTVKARIKGKRIRGARAGELQGPTYRDHMAAAIHEGLEGLAKLGAIEDTEVRSFEKVALVSALRYTADRVREVRRKEQATQKVFAQHLGVSVNTVSQWERGEREVAGAAAKLLSLVEKHGLAYLL